MSSFVPDLLYLSIAITIVLGVFLSWKTTVRDPLDYDIYIVETQADRETSRRVAQVIHIGYEERSVAGSELLNTLQTGRVFQRVEDISVVIQSPSTIVESSSARERPSNAYISSMRLWMMEVLGDYQARREGGSSGLAAAVAIAVANGRNEIQTGETRIRLVDFDRNRRNQEEETIEETGRVEESTPHIQSNDGIERTEEDMEDIDFPSTSSTLPSIDEDDSFPSTSTQSNEEREEERNDRVEETREESLIKIRLKFLDDTGMDVEVALSITLSQLKERICEMRQMGNTNIRLIYRGQLLRNDSDSLEKVGMENDCVVHVLIGGRREEERGGGERRTEGVNGRVEEGGERREEDEERRDDLEGRVAYHMDYIREVINMSALLLMGAADAIGSSWLTIARLVRNRVESRVERAREERRPLGYIDTALVWMAESLGMTERAVAPLPGVPSISILLPFVLTIQIILGWCFVAFFPRFFDLSSIFFLFIITSTYGFFYRQNHARINQRQ